MCSVIRLRTTVYSVQKASLRNHYYRTFLEYKNQDKNTTADLVMSLVNLEYRALATEYVLCRREGVFWQSCIAMQADG